MKLLGQIVLLRVENAQVKHDDLVAWFEELDLDDTFLPARTSPVNSFKKAATGAATKLTYPAPWIDKDAVATVVWEDDSHSQERIVRRAMRTVKIRGKVQPAVMVARVTFYKRSRRASANGQGGEKMRFQIEDGLPPQARPIIEQWLADCQRRYDAGQVWVDTDALRAVARDYLTQRLKAIKVRDGVYFVYKDLEGEMKRLQDLVTRFGDECMFHPIELIDQERHRDLLRGTLSDQLDAEATKVLRDLHALRARYPGRRLPRDKFAPLVTRYEQVMELAHDYAEAIGVVDSTTLDRLTGTIVDMRRSIT